MDTQYTKTQLREMSAVEVANLAHVQFGIDTEDKTKVALIDEILAAQEARNAAADDDADDQGPESGPESTQASDDGDNHINTPNDGGDAPQGKPELPEGCIRVRATGPSNRVTLWEHHQGHPGGQVYIRGGETAVVFRTPAVEQRLGRSLVEVEE